MATRSTNFLKPCIFEMTRNNLIQLGHLLACCSHLLTAAFFHLVPLITIDDDDDATTKDDQRGGPPRPGANPLPLGSGRQGSTAGPSQARNVSGRTKNRLVAIKTRLQELAIFYEKLAY